MLAKQPIKLTGKELIRNKLYDPSKWESETIIDEGEEAPKRGVLVPEYNYRTYQKSLNIMEGVTPEVESLAQECIDEPVPITEIKSSFSLGNGVVLTFTLGALLGFGLAAYSIRK